MLICFCFSVKCWTGILMAFLEVFLGCSWKFECFKNILEVFKQVMFFEGFSRLLSLICKEVSRFLDFLRVHCCIVSTWPLHNYPRVSTGEASGVGFEKVSNIQMSHFVYQTGLTLSTDEKKKNHRPPQHPLQAAYQIQLMVSGISWEFRLNVARHRRKI